MKRLQQRRHGESTGRSTVHVHKSPKPDPSRTGDMGAEGQDLEGTLEVAERNPVASLE